MSVRQAQCHTLTFIIRGAVSRIGSNMRQLHTLGKDGDTFGIGVEDVAAAGPAVEVISTSDPLRTPEKQIGNRKQAMMYSSSTCLSRTLNFVHGFYYKS